MSSPPFLVRRLGEYVQLSEKQVHAFERRFYQAVDSCVQLSEQQFHAFVRLVCEAVESCKRDRLGVRLLGGGCLIGGVSVVLVEGQLLVGGCLCALGSIFLRDIISWIFSRVMSFLEVQEVFPLK